MNANTITTGEVRLSYVNVFEAQTRAGSNDAKFSVTVLVPKTDRATKAAIDAAIAAAIENGVTKCWNGVKPPQPSICVHDGDGVRPSDGQPYGAECKGCWVFTASNKNAPFVVDASVQPILNRQEIYSGIWGRASISFFPYNNNGKKGIGCSLNGIQKLRDGEPLVDRVSADEAFSAAPAPVYPQQPIYPQQPAFTGYGQPAAPSYPPQPAAPAYNSQQPYPGYTPQPTYPQQQPGINPFTGLPM
jgi:hypothetical protein